MASIYTSAASLLLTLLCFFHYTTTPTTAALVKQQPLTLKYHNGALLKGKVTLNLIWYGKFTPAQRSIIVDFIQSLSTPRSPNNPSASTWWRTTEKYKGGVANLILGKQLLHDNYPFGKHLKNSHISVLGRSPATTGPKPNNLPSINVVLTAQDVAVEGFCMRCGSHGSVHPTRKSGAGSSSKATYIWVGNSVTQCPGQCAWPFKQPMYGPQTPPLLPPNGDVGVDGMIINLATLLAGTVTNPFEDGYFQGPANAPLEAVSACTGMFGSGAYPGYPGKVLVDKSSGASFNAYGVNGRKFLLPAMWDPSSSACSTLV